AGSEVPGSQSFPRDEATWTSILARAAAHGVLPLLASRVKRLRLEGVPTTIAAMLQTAYRLNVAHNAMLADELRRVLSLLVEAGVPVIPLKGVALAESLYGDMAVRVCSDLDILVPRSMAKGALEALGPMGYRAEFTSRSVATLMLRHDIEC